MHLLNPATLPRTLNWPWPPIFCGKEFRKASRRLAQLLQRALWTERVIFGWKRCSGQQSKEGVGTAGFRCADISSEPVASAVTAILRPSIQLRYPGSRP